MSIQNPVVVAGISDDVPPQPFGIPLTQGGAAVIVTPSGGTGPKPSPQNPAVPTAASVGVTSTTIVAANANRTGLVIVNTSSNVVSLAFGANAAVLDSGITLNATGGTFEMDAYMFTTEAVNAIASGSSSNVSIQEYS